MTKIITMPKIISKLTKVGFSKEYIRENGLPSWWDNSLDKEPMAVLEGAGHIAKRLNLDLGSLLEEDQPVKFKQLPYTNFKYHNQQFSETPNAAHSIASRVAEVVAIGVQKEFISVAQNAEQVRAEILEKHSRVDLSSILDYCWEHGIAVIYFNNYPSKKITALIQLQCGHPVIVLSSKRRFSSWLAFHLAHELGHLVLGHVKEGMLLVDDQIDSNSLDQEEVQANRFAEDLLLGDCDNCLGDKSFHNYNHLIKYLNISVEEHPTVDPGILALNYAYYNNNLGMANKALEKLYPSDNGQKIINQSLEEHLDWNLYSQDNYDYLDELLGD